MSVNEEARCLQNENDILQYAISNGIISMSSIQDEIAMISRKELLAKHQYKIWQGKDGKWYTYLPDDEKGRLLKKRNTEKDIEDVVVDYWKEKVDNPTVKEVFDEWNNRKLTLKKISKSTYCRNQRFFKRHYEEMGKRRIKSVSPEEWSDFLEEQIPKYDLTAKAFSGLKGITKGFLLRAKKRGLINFIVDDLFADLDVSDVDFKKTIKEDYQEVFSEEETPVIMDYLRQNCDMINAVILLMFVSGIRNGEAVTLKHCDIQDNTINIRRTETLYKDESGKNIYDVKDFPKTGAGVRTVVIPLNYAWLLKHIQTYNPSGEFIFAPNSKRIHTDNVRNRLKTVCKNLNIYPKSPHKIRKTYGTILLDNNLDSRLIIDQMGHTDILCTETHYHRNRKSIDKKSSIISSLPDFDYQVIKSNHENN